LALPIRPITRFDGSLVKRRVTALALTIAAHVLLILLLLTLAPPLVPRKIPDNPLLTFDVPAAARKPTPRSRTVAKQRSVSPPPPQAPVIAQQVPTPVMPYLIPGLERFDLRQLPRAAEPSQSADADGQGQNSGSSYGPGEGPGGARLYNAEWYREPTQAELSAYLPARLQPGWGMIACQTIARYRVDNCRVLGSEPPGSGLGGAVRQAAWQFLVRPPRIDGKPLIGAWVKIRIEFTPAGEIRH
jgi:protein TonB